MKKVYSLITAFALSISAFAQAPVPTSYDFENGGIFPTGWTLNALGAGTQYYTSAFACGSSAYSLKFDANNESLVINLASQPGVVTYNIKANTGSATPWNGNFQVQESANGTLWTAIKTYSGTGGAAAGGLDVHPAACVAQSVTPTNTASRYIRFIYLTKTTGNVSVDDINIALPILPVAMKVLQGTSQISNGGLINPIGTAVSSTTVLPLTIQNYGNSTVLNITNAVISGANASEFVPTTAVPLNVNPASTAAYNINFMPMAAGTRTAVLTFTTNDPNNSTYVVYLYGVGGTYATAPTVQANTLTFPLNKTYRINGQFNTVNSSLDQFGGYIILRKNNGAVTDVPVNGTTYQRGQYIGGSQVVYSGKISGATGAFSPAAIRASVNYGFAIFTYNGAGAYISYNVTSPLAQTITTPFSMMPANEYSTINTASTTFLTNLSTLINPHTAIFYSNYTPTMINKFESRDTLITSPVLFTKFVVCNYSGLIRPYNDPFDYTALDFARDHSFPHSWMPTFPADNPEKPEYNDQHNLYLVKQTNVNSTRSNYPLGDVVTPTSTYLAFKMGTNATGQTVAEVRPVHKGNVARALFYMATAYNGVTGNNWKFKNPISGTIAYGQDQDLLKKWHFEDLPDSYERSRNDFLDSLQGNRNPFIDSARYACYIDFTTMTYVANPTFPCYTSITSVRDAKTTHFEYVLAPNPTSGEFYLLIDATVAEKFNLDITDITGRTVYNRNVDVANGFNNIVVNDIKLKSGIYFVNLNYKNEKITRKLIIQ